MHERVNLNSIFACLIAAIFLSCCSGCDTNDDAKKPSTAESKRFNRVAVTNYPLFCFVRKICEKEDAVAEVIYVGPHRDDDPHAWIPSTEQIRDLQQVDLIVCNGPGAKFANWMDKVTVDEDKVCNTTDAISMNEFVVVEDFRLVHSHGPEGEHSHSWVVPQSWLSPRIARKQVTLCVQKLSELYGPSKAMDASFGDLQKSFDDLEARIEQIRNATTGQVVASSTPDSAYLLKSLGWTNHYLQWNEARGVEQATEEITDMRARYSDSANNADSADAVDAKPESLFLWSGDVMDQLSVLVDETWDRVATIDLIDSSDSPDSPIGDVDSPDDYFARMKKNLERIGGHDQ